MGEVRRQQIHRTIEPALKRKVGDGSWQMVHWPIEMESQREMSDIAW